MNPSAPASDRPAEGAPPATFSTEVFGKYFLVDKIAMGGMAEIFKAKTFGCAVVGQNLGASFASRRNLGEFA